MTVRDTLKICDTTSVPVYPIQYLIALRNLLPSWTITSWLYIFHIEVIIISAWRRDTPSLLNSFKAIQTAQRLAYIHTRTVLHSQSKYEYNGLADKV